MVKNAKKESKTATVWTFPKNTLEDALKIAKAIEEQNAGNAWKADMLAKAVADFVNLTIGALKTC